MTTPEVRAEALAYMRGERPYEDDSMARYRAEYLVTWRYVSGGRARHAFFGSEELPACGLVALRGPEESRRPSRWITVGMDLFAGRRPPAHHACEKAVSRRRSAYVLREQELSRVRS